MPSRFLQSWRTTRAAALDEVENAHRMVGGVGPGRRYATQQINHAYAMLLSSQFQGFCRDLHSECIDLLVRAITPAIVQPYIYTEFMLGRKLDKGNPNPGNIGADFERLGFRFWPAVDADDARNPNRKSALEEMNKWRNAIAHQDFDPAILAGRTTLHLHEVKAWRRACDGLAQSFDNVLRAHLQLVCGGWPW
jgi:hypothetical protein